MLQFSPSGYRQFSIQVPMIDVVTYDVVRKYVMGLQDVQRRFDMQ